MTWNNIEARELSWSEMWEVSDKRISMLIKSAYNVLGTPSNLKLWKLRENDECELCGKSPCNLKHILSNCSVALFGGRYTWRHDRVLKYIVTTCEEIVDKYNVTPHNTKPVTNIRFIRKGEPTPAKAKKEVRRCILGVGSDWTVLCDLSSQLVVPDEIAITLSRPDILMMSRKTKAVILCELTCPWEENAEWAHERKLEKYEELKNQMMDNGWSVRVYAVEVGCRGFVSRTLRGFLKDIGCSNRKIKKTIKDCCEAAERSSVSIYMSRSEARWKQREG